MENNITNKTMPLDEPCDFKLDLVRDEEGKIISGGLIDSMNTWMKENPIDVEFEDIEVFKEAIPYLDEFPELKQEIINYQNECIKDACKHNFEIAKKSKAKATILEQQNNELEQENKDLSTTITTNFRILPKPQQHTKTEKPNNLDSYLTEKQIQRIHTNFAWLFDADLEQWQNLFSDNEIQPFTKPIILRSGYKTDVATFLHFLKENDFIRRIQYPSIIGRVEAFSHNNDIITAKQLNDAKSQNMNFPRVGTNFGKIEEIIINLKQAT